MPNGANLINKSNIEKVRNNQRTELLNAIVRIKLIVPSKGSANLDLTIVTLTGMFKKYTCVI